MGGMISFPLMFILFSIAEPLVRTLLTDKWLPAVPFLQILCIGSMFDPVMRLNSIILSVTGKTQYSLFSEILKKSILLILLFATLPLGIKWVTIGAAIYPICDMIVVSFFVKKIIPCTLVEEIKLLLPYLLLSGISYITANWVISMLEVDICKIVAGIMTFSFLYLLLLQVFIPQQLKLIKSKIKSIISQNG